jgi:hypothetical protein
MSFGTIDRPRYQRCSQQVLANASSARPNGTALQTDHRSRQCDRLSQPLRRIMGGWFRRHRRATGVRTTSRPKHLSHVIRGIENIVGETVNRRVPSVQAVAADDRRHDGAGQLGELFAIRRAGCKSISAWPKPDVQRPFFAALCGRSHRCCCHCHGDRQRQCGNSSEFSAAMATEVL